MTLIWTIVCDVLIFVGKYLKKFNRWFDVHAWVFLALGICSAIFTSMAPDYEVGGDDRRLRMLALTDLSDNERILLESWGNSGLHETTGGLGNIITYILIIQGLFLRF